MTERINKELADLSTILNKGQHLQVYASNSLLLGVMESSVSEEHVSSVINAARSIVLNAKGGVEWKASTTSGHSSPVKWIKDNLLRGIRLHSEM